MTRPLFGMLVALVVGCDCSPDETPSQTPSNEMTQPAAVTQPPTAPVQAPVQPTHEVRAPVWTAAGEYYDGQLHGAAELRRGAEILRQGAVGGADPDLQRLGLLATVVGRRCNNGQMHLVGPWSAL